ncbi:MAG TPA: transcriptional regulator [Telluria sp.]|nr:transcriptional regulator [Telluria sp.]
MDDLKGCRTFDEWALDEMRSDREFAIEVFKVTLESMAKPDEIPGALQALRSLAEACGGIGSVATSTGLSREALYRSLSENGNPTIRTLFSVLDALGLRLSVVPAGQDSSADLANDAPSSVESRVA